MGARIPRHVGVAEPGGPRRHLAWHLTARVCAARLSVHATVARHTMPTCHHGRKDAAADTIGPEWSATADRVTRKLAGLAGRSGLLSTSGYHGLCAEGVQRLAHRLSFSFVGGSVHALSTVLLLPATRLAFFSGASSLHGPPPVRAIRAHDNRGVVRTHGVQQAKPRACARGDNDELAPRLARRQTRQPPQRPPLRACARRRHREDARAPLRERLRPRSLLREASRPHG